MTLYLISFIAGILTVLSPCVLPVLPIVLGSASSTKSKNELYLTVLSLGLSVFLFSILLQTSLKFNPFFEFLPDRFWVILSGGVITFFGIVTIFPQIWDKLSLNLSLSKKSNNLLEKSQQTEGIAKPILLGASLGPVFTSCSPTYFVILGLITSSSYLEGVILLGIYILGMVGFLFIIGLFGYRITSKFKIFADPEGIVRKMIGVLFLVIGVGIILGYDKSLETFLLDLGVYDNFSQLEINLQNL